MNNLHKLALISTISFGFFTQANPVSAQRQNITCQSQRGRYQFCDVDTRGGVKFIRQISNAECRKGSTWGYDRNGIWVDQGCGAEFSVRDRGGNNNNYNSNSGGSDTAAIIGGVLAVGAIAAAIASGSNNSNNNSNNNNSSFNDTITCGSDRGNFIRCNTNIRRGDRVVLRRQLSNSGCWQGETWDYDRNGIWVDQGCRGQFEIIR
ncbi:DUF3011 domain-containing protein [Geminocystis sp. NIES-3709]|uniref:DUF3011 domain-containing protein n=1 Tax=Geminocystis sp. NIES-3709 TaxID=1617448 RepID=UPI0005FCCF54|nr:DUF3011 domain-containing protein [Geminocystis sp. NIES-3709]BAQ65420.1 hypothetical protein GM3709_2185 [Geminocystis sp. NIES-3709]